MFEEEFDCHCLVKGSEMVFWKDIHQAISYHNICESGFKSSHPSRGR